MNRLNLASLNEFQSTHISVYLSLVRDVMIKRTFSDMCGIFVCVCVCVCVCVGGGLRARIMNNHGAK